MNVILHLTLSFLVLAASPSEVDPLQAGDEVDIALRIGTRIIVERTSIRVAPDGFLYLPTGGKVDVRNKSYQQIREEIAKESQRSLRLKREPTVEFSIRELVPRYRDSVSVIGAVSEPGPIPFQDGLTLRTAIARAGGFLPKLNVQQVRLVRGDKVTTLTSNDALIGDSSSTGLEPGDIVVVSEADRPVTVFGIVASPGPVDWFDGMRVIDAIALAGGVDFLPPGEGREVAQADVGAVRIIRGTLEIPVNLTPMFSPRPNLSEVPLVQPGDLIYVPPLKDRSTVIGAVTRPGSYLIKKDDRLLDLLGEAGLNLNEIDRGGEIMIRRGDREVKHISVTGLLIKGDQQLNVTLQAGDLVVIPFAGSVSVVGEVRQPGAFPITGADRAYNLIYRAGGPTDRADLENITVLRDGKPFIEHLRLDPAKQGGVQPEIRPGDVILVPPRDGVYVVGAVNSPGFVPYQPNLTLLDAFTHARWMSVGADIKNVSIVRVHQGRIVTLVPDVQALIARNDRSQNVTLLSGDTVIVPFRRPPRTSLLNQISPFTLFGYLAPFVIRR